MKENGSDATPQECPESHCELHRLQSEIFLLLLASSKQVYHCRAHVANEAGQRTMQTTRSRKKPRRKEPSGPWEKGYK